LLTARLADLSVEDLRDLGDEHAAVAGMAAALAAERGTRAELDRLEGFNQELREATTHWHQCRADSHFHVQIAVAAGSPRLTRAEVRLQAESVEYLWITDTEEPDQASAVRSHDILLEAILAKDAARAGELAQKHVRKNVAFITALHARVSRDRKH
jgi:GntR family L-lactate dehydrogenase operon transcriptional regulator